MPDKDLSEADQKKLLEEANNVVQVQGFLMKRALVRYTNTMAINDPVKSFLIPTLTCFGG